MLNRISSIYEYGIFHFGLEQAQKYITGLYDSFEVLAKAQFIGRDASELFPGLRKLIFRSHMIFYLSTDYGVLIVRVLHQSRDYLRFFEQFQSNDKAFMEFESINANQTLVRWGYDGHMAYPMNAL